jgi:hypothetical protein
MRYHPLPTAGIIKSNCTNFLSLFDVNRNSLKTLRMVSRCSNLRRISTYQHTLLSPSSSGVLLSLVDLGCSLVGLSPILSSLRSSLVGLDSPTKCSGSGRVGAATLLRGSARSVLVVGVLLVVKTLHLIGADLVLSPSGTVLQVPATAQDLS